MTLRELLYLLSLVACSGSETSSGSSALAVAASNSIFTHMFSLNWLCSMLVDVEFLAAVCVTVGAHSACLTAQRYLQCLYFGTVIGGSASFSDGNGTSNSLWLAVCLSVLECLSVSSRLASLPSRLLANLHGGHLHLIVGSAVTVCSSSSDNSVVASPPAHSSVTSCLSELVVSLPSVSAGHVSFSHTCRYSELLFCRLMPLG